MARLAPLGLSCIALGAGASAHPVDTPEIRQLRAVVLAAILQTIAPKQ